MRKEKCVWNSGGLDWLGEGNILEKPENRSNRSKIPIKGNLDDTKVELGQALS